MRTLILFFAIFIFPLTSFGYDPNTKLTIITHDYPPFSYMEDNEVKGLSTEILREVLKEMKHENLEIMIFPWKRAYVTVYDSKNLLLYSVARKPHREKHFIWAGRSGPRSVGMYKLKSRKDIIVPDIEHAKKYHVASTKGAAYTKAAYDKGFSGIQENPTLIQSIRMLYSRRVDLIIADEVALVHSIRAYNKEAAVENILDESQIERVVYFSPKSHRWFAFGAKSDQELVNRFQSAYETVEKKGVIDKLQSQYLVE
ncbi:MAG: transporter substrate-binding domain-containing protein [Gammaproteobacteria bacterium]|nr:transporter substrate-binding domain-containing protein [Gammaproteobacteria bacterium]